MTSRIYITINGTDTGKWFQPAEYKNFNSFIIDVWNFAGKDYTYEKWEGIHHQFITGIWISGRLWEYFEFVKKLTAEERERFDAYIKAKNPDIAKEPIEEVFDIFKESQDLIEKVAREFSKEIINYVGENIQEVIKRNNTPEYKGSDCCATHDFCDANIFMHDALIKFNLDPFSEDDENRNLADELWHKAWKLAKGSNFFHAITQEV